VEISDTRVILKDAKLPDGTTKTIEAVDGGTDAPGNYWLVSGKLSGIVPKFSAAP